MAFSRQEPWRSLSLLTDAPKTFYEVLGLPVLEEFPDFQESLQRRLVSLPSHVSQAERFMFSMLGDEVPCRPLHSRSDIRRAIVKQLVRVKYFVCVPDWMLYSCSSRSDSAEGCKRLAKLHNPLA